MDRRRVENRRGANMDTLAPDDPSLNLIYWGTGNPSPDWNGDVRPGDNLYSSSVVALNPDTGKLKWYFQFTPHDVHDWDAVQIPVLVDAQWSGRSRKLMYWANRNCFFYVLDRETGEFLRGEAFAKQTWAKGLDTKGHPVRIPGTNPSPEGTLVFPGVQGGTNWYSPSYSPRTGLFYMSVWEYASIYYTGDAPYSPGNRFIGSAPQGVPDTPHLSRSRDRPTTGKRVWDFPLTPKPRRASCPPLVGWFSEETTKATSSLLITRPAKNSGAPQPEAKSSPHPSPTCTRANN